MLRNRSFLMLEHRTFRVLNAAMRFQLRCVVILNGHHASHTNHGAEIRLLAVLTVGTSANLGWC